MIWFMKIKMPSRPGSVLPEKLFAAKDSAKMLLDVVDSLAESDAGVGAHVLPLPLATCRSIPCWRVPPHDADE
jgi:hypothetical protein